VIFSASPIFSSALTRGQTENIPAPRQRRVN
jgi:hypothetical protein